MMKELTVDLGSRSYPIYIGEGIVLKIASLLEKNGIKPTSPLLLITDDHVAAFHLNTVKEKLEQGGYQVNVHIVPAGESTKSLASLEQIIRVALEAGLDRNSVIVALGGGVVGDLAGFAAASYMRGIRFVQLPTTILAHDSSVGGKVAVNHPLAKNVIGAFHQPELVLYDTELLLTLPPREVRSGYAEVIKHGLIRDADFVSWLNEHADELLALDLDLLGHALYTGCKVKVAVVSQDERETGLRAILNLGHTIGHALEAVAGYGVILHGEGIAIGMVGAARLAVQLGRPERIHTITKQIFQRFQLPVVIPAQLDTDAIMAAMMHDKKFKEGRMTFVLPVDIGEVDIYEELTTEQVRAVVSELKQEGLLCG
ncbi:MAG: 3-dehydroquinate synthase [Gorillibacterium sp.]|nr:3-dehydroquinate synthase [Gorillibacterium sp.]